MPQQPDSSFTVPSSLTLIHAPQALAAGLEAIRQGAAQFDFTAVIECDSAGVALCVRWSAASRERGAAWIGLNVPPALRRLAQVYDLDAALFGTSGVSGAVEDQRKFSPEGSIS